MQKYLFKNIGIVNEGRIIHGDVLIGNERILRIANVINPDGENVLEIDGEGKYLLPGCIDDQVHFREPGLTQKATIYTEAKAAVAGGVTSFMEMPNTNPPAFTRTLLEQKYERAAQTSLGNYSFYMGTSNDNVEEVLRINEAKDQICGVKIFMGSSTGNLLVDNYLTLGRIFGESELLIATHCEDEAIIKANFERIKSAHPVLQPSDHPLIRDEEACFESSFKAVQLAMKHNTRLHILHISTERELSLFTNLIPLSEKRITAEVCVHHLHFTSADYDRLGNFIKCNPAIKAPMNKEALWKAMLDDRLDVIATDHAPHTFEEKDQPYEKSPSGIPLVQHALPLMLDYYRLGKINLETIARKMSHAVADCFQIKERGYIREGYFADVVVIEPGQTEMVSKENILYKCGWSPFEGIELPVVSQTFINGNLVFDRYGKQLFNESIKGKRLTFDRN